MDFQKGQRGIDRAPPAILRSCEETGCARSEVPVSEEPVGEELPQVGYGPYGCDVPDRIVTQHQHESFPDLRWARSRGCHVAASPDPPKPIFTLRRNQEAPNRRSGFVAAIIELPEEIYRVLEVFRYTCLAAETDSGVVHVPTMGLR